MRHFLALLFALLPPTLSAATYYVRDGGDGSTPTTSWAGAYDQLSSAVAAASRGDTIYVADGDYNAPTLSTATSGTSTITIKKATVADHGTSTGWSDAYGDGQAVFSGTVLIHTGRYIIDGQVGGGPGSWKTGHGFRVNGQIQIISAAFDVGVAIPGGNIELHHIRIVGTFTPSTDDAISANNLDGLVISHVYTDDTDNCPVNLFLTTNVTWEYCYHGRFTSSEEHHAEIVFLYGKGGVTIRYNLFRWAQSTGGIMVHNPDELPVLIYGNVIYRESSETWSYGGDGLIGGWSNRADLETHNVKVFNNTLINVPSDAAGIIGTTPHSGLEWKNNYAYNTDTGLPNGAWDHDYNHYQDSGSESESNGTTGTGNPFVSLDETSADFAKLTADTTAGTNLGAPYNVDWFGNTGTSRGAIQFQSGGGGEPGSTVSTRNGGAVLINSL